MKPIKAVIFDMDGVLIDSEPVYLHHQYAHLKPSYPWIIPLKDMQPGFLRKNPRNQIL